MCRSEAHCFAREVESAPVGEAGEKIVVRDDAATCRYDPENCEPTLEQAGCVAGSHRRVVLAVDPEQSVRRSRARTIWKGD